MKQSVSPGDHHRFSRMSKVWSCCGVTRSLVKTKGIGRHLADVVEGRDIKRRVARKSFDPVAQPIPATQAAAAKVGFLQNLDQRDTFRRFDHAALQPGGFPRRNNGGMGSAHDHRAGRQVHHHGVGHGKVADIRDQFGMDEIIGKGEGRVTASVTPKFGCKQKTTPRRAYPVRGAVFTDAT